MLSGRLERNGAKGRGLRLADTHPDNQNPRMGDDYDEWIEKIAWEALKDRSELSPDSWQILISELLRILDQERKI